ncbi:MAG TPA: circadian clock KaiB family protein [bacterium]|nr:circadian clock KaiB family protein [bacterium]
MAKNEDRNRNLSNMENPKDQEWIFRLYVTGTSPKSVKAFNNLKKICEEYLEAKYAIEVIDLDDNSKPIKGDQILAVPTLVRRSPAPKKTIIGDLSDTKTVLTSLDLQDNGE